MLAGDVLVAVTGGRLLITGDDQANVIAVSTNAGVIRVTGTGTTLNGAADPLQVAFTGDVVLRMGGGNDDVDIGDGVQLPKGLTAELGDGTNTLDIGQVGFNGRATIRGGAGSDTIGFTGSVLNRGLTATDVDGLSFRVDFVECAVLGDASITSNSTVLTVNSHSSRFWKNLKLTQKGSASAITIDDSAAQGARVDGNLTIKGGTGLENVTFQQVTFGKSVKTDLGLGTATSTLTITDSTIAGNFTATAREGASEVTFDTTNVQGAVSYSHATGDADMHVAGGSTVSGTTRVCSSRGDARYGCDLGHVGRKLTVFAGGAATVYLGQGVQCTFGSVDVNSRTGYALMDFTSIRVLGSTVVRYGAGGELSVQLSNFDGRFALVGGAGADSLSLDTTVFLGAISIVTGEGNDDIGGGDLVVTGKTTASLGGGNDRFRFQLVAGWATEFNGGLNLNAGSGDDTLQLGGADADFTRAVLGQPSVVDAGAGADTLVTFLDPASEPLVTRGLP